MNIYSRFRLRELLSQLARVTVQYKHHPELVLRIASNCND